MISYNTLFSKRIKNFVKVGQLAADALPAEGQLLHEGQTASKGKPLKFRIGTRMPTFSSASQKAIIFILAA
jgi:hypothetical protein